MFCCVSSVKFSYCAAIYLHWRIFTSESPCWRLDAMRFLVYEAFFQTFVSFVWERSRRKDRHKNKISALRAAKKRGEEQNVFWFAYRRTEAPELCFFCGWIIINWGGCTKCPAGPPFSGVSRGFLPRQIAHFDPWSATPGDNPPSVSRTD